MKRCDNPPCRAIATRRVDVVQGQRVAVSHYACVECAADSSVPDGFKKRVREYTDRETDDWGRGNE